MNEELREEKKNDFLKKGKKKIGNRRFINSVRRKVKEYRHKIKSLVWTFYNLLPSTLW